MKGRSIALPLQKILRIYIIILKQPAAKCQLSRRFDLVYSAEVCVVRGVVEQFGLRLGFFRDLEEGVADGVENVFVPGFVEPILGNIMRAYFYEKQISCTRVSLACGSHDLASRRLLRQTLRIVAGENEVHISLPDFGGIPD